MKRLLKAAERSITVQLIHVYQGNSNKMWSILKNIIDRNKEKYINTINRRLKLSGESIANDKKLISDKFYDFFINEGSNIAKALRDKIKVQKH